MLSRTLAEQISTTYIAGWVGNMISYITDVPIPAASRGDGTHHHVARALARTAVQRPACSTHRLRARLHEYQSRRLHRIRQVTKIL